MHIKIKRCLGLILLAGLLLAALLQGLTPQGGTTVDIKASRGGKPKGVTNRAVHDIASSYNDVHVREGVARCAPLLLCSTFVFEFFCPHPSSDFSSRRRQLSHNTCACVGDEESFRLPFSNYLYPRVWAHNVGVPFLESQPDPEETKRHRAEEYSQHQNRSHRHTHTHELTFFGETR